MCAGYRKTASLLAGVCLAASAVIGTEYPEYLVEETADDINEQVLVANESGVWRYDVSSTNWTARGKFADALGAKSVVQAGTTVYIATWLNGVGKILTCGQRGGALGEFATLSFQPTKLAVSRDGASLWVSGFGANGGVWRYPLADASAAARVVSSCQAAGVQETAAGTLWVPIKAPEGDQSPTEAQLAAVGRTVGINHATVYSAADGRTCLALPDVPDAAEHRFTLTY